MAAQAEEIRLEKTRDNAAVDGAGHGDEDFDPHKHRNVPNPTNNWETLIHLLKGAIGTGILAMPQAFSKAGLITGIIGTMFLGFLATYCIHVLVQAQYNLCKRKRVGFMSYPESMREALLVGPKCLRRLARPSYFIVDFFLCIYQLGICCVYVVFIGRTVKLLVDPVYKMDVQYWMLILLLPLIGINCIRNLKLLAPWSIAANIMTLLGLSLVIYYLLTGPRVEEEKDLWGSLRTFPLFFGTALFAFITVGVVLALESNMSTPKSFGGYCGVFNISMIGITFMYTIIGVVGYRFCVSKCEDSITLSIRDGDIIGIFVNVLYAFAIFISYGLQCYVPVQILWGYISRKLGDRPNLLKYEYALRITLCLLTFVVAVSVPRLGLFISLFGAFCLSALGLAFPAIMEFCTKYPKDFGPLNYIIIKDVLLFLFGCLGLVIGTYVSMSAIIDSFGKRLTIIDIS